MGCALASLVLALGPLGCGAAVPSTTTHGAPGPPSSSPVRAGLRIRDYELAVRIVPASHSLVGDATLRLEGAPPGPFVVFLHRGFEVTAAFVNGREARAAWGDEALKMPYVEPARALVITPREPGEEARELRIVYRGSIEKPIADVNMIRADLVELASYAGYYPMIAGAPHFPSTLTVTLPKGFTTIARGERTRESVDGAEQIVVWRARTPAGDIPLFASNDIQVEKQRTGEIEVSVFFRSLARDDARASLKEAVATLDFLSRDQGAPTAQALRMVFSPRGGWGYSRTGYFVVSEERHESLSRATPSGSSPPDESLHGNAHEISHFWWNIADATTPEDWLNESLAEYSAAVDSRRRLGDAGYRAWATHYLQSLHDKPPPVGILATRATDTFRYRSWYERGALFFMCLEAELGRPHLLELLRGLIAIGHARPIVTADLRAALHGAGIEDAWVASWLDEAGIEVADRCVGRMPK